MKISGFKAIYPNQELIPSVKTFTENVKKDYQTLRSNGLFNNSKQEGIYVYQIIYKGNEYKGIVCSTHVNHLKSDIIKKHEHTLAEKEQLMIQLILQRNAMVKPVLLTYPKEKDVHGFLVKVIKERKPFYTVSYSADEKHTLWNLTKALNAQLIKLFDKHVKHTMIADGHHRCSTSLLMYKGSKDKIKYSKLFTAIFSNDQLKILDFNRIINLKAMMNPLSFMAMLAKYCNIKPIAKGKKPGKNHVMTMYLGKEWYQLAWKKKYIKKSMNTDPALFNELVLKKILGVKDVRTDNRIKYLSGEVPLETLVSTTDNFEQAVGFCIYPLQMSYINSVVDNGETLPPKSSYFVPRLRNGIISMDFEIEYS